MALRNARDWREARDIASGAANGNGAVKRNADDAFGSGLVSKVARLGGAVSVHSGLPGALDRANPFPASLAAPTACGKKKIFKGLYCPTLTPLSADGALDLSSIPDYGRFLLADGVNGVFVNGTSGMSNSLSVSERKAVLDAWVAFARKHKKLEVIAHIGAQSVDESRELAAHAEALGVAAISAMTPSFFKPATVDLLAEHVAHVAAAAPNTPFLYYHFPDITGVSFPLKDVMAALHQAVPTLRGAKFTSTHMWDLGDCVDLGKSLGTEWDLMMGYEGQTLSALPLGIDAHIGICCNGMAPTWNRLIRAFDKGDIKGAAKEQEIGRKWFQMFSAVVGLWNMGHACKVMLADRMGGKHDFGGTKPPQKAFTAGETQALRSAWNKFKSEHGGAKLFDHQGAIGEAPKAVAAPAKVVDFAALPGAKGELDNLCRERLALIARELSLDAGSLRTLFPHLYPGSTGHAKFDKPDPNGPICNYIDHTLLKADAKTPAIQKLCEEAKKHKFFGVCVNSGRVAQTCDFLRGTDVAVVAVCGFPLGAMESKSKVREAVECVKLGATEIDMVLNIAKLQEGDYKTVGNEISDLVDAVRRTNPKALVKVIMETCLLTTEQIIDASLLCVLADADFVKTSTGFSTSGATPEALDKMMAAVGRQCLIKAAGGVKTPETARQFVKAGIHRIGTSSGVALVSGTAAGAGY